MASRAQFFCSPFSHGTTRGNDEDRLQATFAEREPLTSEQFFEAHFRSRGAREEVSTGIRRILSEQFGEDMSRLAAADDFTTNLKFLFDSDSLVDVEIVLALEDAFAIKITG